jgi:hypothetical protein
VRVRPDRVGHRAASLGDLARSTPLVDPAIEWGDLLDLIVKPTWTRDGLCREPSYSTVDWFPHPSDVVSIDAAKAVCSACLAVDECRARALELGPTCYGVWGATSEADRTAIRRGAAA